MPFDYYDVDYQMLDSLARHFAGVPVQMTPPPLWLMIEVEPAGQPHAAVPASSRLTRASS